MIKGSKKEVDMRHFNFKKIIFLIPFFMIFSFCFLIACQHSDTNSSQFSQKPQINNNSIVIESNSVVIDKTINETINENTSKIENKTLSNNTKNEIEQTKLINQEELPQSQKLVMIDPGHQSIINTDVEPIGPASNELKLKMSSGTQGIVTGIPEYQLNLEVSLKLEKELLKRGYQVEMTRRENEVNISNIERAEMANQMEADAFIRIHANGSNDSSVQGMMTICQTENNPFNANIASDCELLSNFILDAMVESTDAVKQYVWKTDIMSGINWSNVPVTIVEIGYMSNSAEDLRLAESEYQEKIVKGIANGIDDFFGF